MEFSESQTVHREISQLSQISIHFDKEEVKLLYYNLNFNYLKVSELLSNLPAGKIKAQIEAFEAKSVSKSEFAANLNQILVQKFKEDEVHKKKVKIEFDISSWPNKSNSPLLSKVGAGAWAEICQYLDIYSLYNLCTTEKFLYKFERTHPGIYKNYCAVAFRQLPQSNDGIYNHLKELVGAVSIHEIDASRKSAILQNVRYQVWGKDPSKLKTSKRYFLTQDGQQPDMRELFFKFPRIRFDGYFSCCETYLRKGTADITGFYVPVHYIKSYRYLRFWDDGKVLYYISTKKFTEEQAIKTLTLESFQRKVDRAEITSVMLGEFIISNDKVHIKMPDKTWVNEMEHVLKFDDGSGFTFLQIVSHQMRDMVTGAVHQMEKDMKEKERFYYFKRIEAFSKDQSSDSCHIYGWQAK